MDRSRLSLERILPPVTAATGAILGFLMLLGSLGLGFALAVSAQPPSQFATAAILLVTGAVNLLSSPGVWRKKRPALAASAAASAALIVYLAVFEDFGESLVLHGVYLILLAVIAYQRRRIVTAA
jgi:uncharacterized membrane protein (DUF2068 family)